MDRKDVIPDQPIGALEMPSHIEAPAELISDTRPAVATVTAEVASPAENPELAGYHQEYSRLPADVKSRATWETITQKLLANDSEKLKLAQAMQGGGELFGVGAEGVALFKDKGTEPVMFGFDEKGKMIQVYDRDPMQMDRIKKWADYSEIREQVQKDGYELFPYKGDYDFSNEMSQVQRHTKEPFVASKDRSEWIFSWLESGDKSNIARFAIYCPNDGHVYVRIDFSRLRDSRYGAVRLLRV